ncbi:MAG: alkaline shock response membrane anchor protein AmaP [Candidatus Omnitrophota bacterium]
MRIMIMIAIFFYVIVITITGMAGLVLLAHWVDLAGYQRVLSYVYTDPKAGTITAFTVAVIMVISFVLARIIYGRQERESNFTFDNPLGRVTISLAALEDLIRRLAARSPQIKEIRPDITSSKKGLKVDIRLVLRSDVSIAELTADLQELIKRKIQDVMGKEVYVRVLINVIKISTDNVTHLKKGIDEDEIEPPLHFHGYRA